MAAVDIESLLIALVLIVVLALGYRALRRHAKPSAPEHFFGGVGEETVLTETRGSPSELPPPREQHPAGQPRA
jgi:hypothetical protein